MPIHEYPRPEFQPFRIIVRIDGVNRRLRVLQTLQGIGEEHYQVTARNKVLVFSTNKPIVERRGLKDFPWTWKLIKGELHSQRAQEAIIAAWKSVSKGKTARVVGCMRRETRIGWQT
jgi:hypothetical protein